MQFDLLMGFLNLRVTCARDGLDRPEHVKRHTNIQRQRIPPVGGHRSTINVEGFSHTLWKFNAEFMSTLVVPSILERRN
jgi:hypothetical protein